MNLIKFAIDRPTAVMAAVIMAVLFGAVALNTIPIQLAPDVARPVIDIRTNWLGAAPAEVEREILNLQEEQMKGLSGLERMEGRALQSQARLKLEFVVGTDMDKALLLVSNRLDGGQLDHLLRLHVGAGRLLCVDALRREPDQSPRDHRTEGDVRAAIGGGPLRRHDGPVRGAERI